MAISVSAKRRWWSRVGATETDTATAAWLDAAVVVRGLVAACAFGAAAIHFGFAPDHFGESRFHGAFFFLAGWAQLAFGLAVILRPSRAVLRVGILLNVAIVVLWAVSRIAGMPFGDDPWVAEAVTFPDTLATVLEVLAVVGSYLLLAGRLERRAVPRAAVVFGGVGIALAIVGLTTASVAPALSGGHRHGAAGHTHTDSATGVGHTHAGAVTGAGGHGTGTGTAAVAAGIESGNGTSPCEQAGANVEGNSHGHSGPTLQQSNAFEILHHVGRSLRVYHQADFSGCCLEPTVHGVETNPLAGVCLRNTHCHPVAKDGLEGGLHKLPVRSLNSGAALCAARSVTIDVDRAAMTAPIFGNAAADSRRRAMPGDVDFTDYTGSLASAGKPLLLTD